MVCPALCNSLILQYHPHPPRIVSLFVSPYWSPVYRDESCFLYIFTLSKESSPSKALPASITSKTYADGEDRF